MEQRILVILPHPDDEAFIMSGTLAKLIDEGAQVTYACLTLGEMGRNMGVPPFANRVTLPAVRRIELEESCRVIGIQDLRMLGYHDKTIEFEDKRGAGRSNPALIEELHPSLTLTFHPKYSVHADPTTPAGRRLFARSGECRQTEDRPCIAWRSPTTTRKRSVNRTSTLTLETI